MFLLSKMTTSQLQLCPYSKKMTLFKTMVITSIIQKMIHFFSIMSSLFKDVRRNKPPHQHIFNSFQINY